MVSLRGHQNANLTACTARLHIQRLIDRLGRHPHLLVSGKLASQPPGDLLGPVAQLEIVLDLRAQHQVRRQLRRLRTAGTPRRPARAPSSRGTAQRHVLRASPRLIVYGLAPTGPRSRASSLRPHVPARSPHAQQTTDNEPCRSRPRRGRTPPASRSHFRPRQRCVPASAAASLRNSPACSASQTAALSRRPIGSRISSSTSLRSSGCCITARTKGPPLRDLVSDGSVGTAMRSAPWRPRRSAMRVPGDRPAAGPASGASSRTWPRLGQTLDRTVNFVRQALSWLGRAHVFLRRNRVAPSERAALACVPGRIGHDHPVSVPRAALAAFKDRLPVVPPWCVDPSRIPLDGVRCCTTGYLCLAADLVVTDPLAEQPQIEVGRLRRAYGRDGANGHGERHKDAATTLACWLLDDGQAILL
jgi:hypothetical protein